MTNECNESADWKSVAMELAKRVNFVLTHVEGGKDGFLIDIMLPREVVEQALNALNLAYDGKCRLDTTPNATDALRAALEQPQGEQEPDAFYEWWRMRPSLTRLQAWLIWKDEHKQPERPHGIGGKE